MKKTAIFQRTICSDQLLQHATGTGTGHSLFKAYL